MHAATRRGVLVMLAATSVGALAQPQPVQLGTLGVFSMLGDSVQVVAGLPNTGTRLDTTERESLDFKGIGFDPITLKAVGEHVRRVQPAAKLQLFQAPAGLTLEQQRAIAAGAEKAQLPGWMVDAIERNKLSHLLIVTRTRGPIDARTVDNSLVGRADVDGIGFYLDRLYTGRNVNTGAVSNGLIAPYVQIRLMLLDAVSGDVVGRHDVRRAYAHGSETNQLQGDPWTYMTMEEKVKALRGMVEQGVTGGVAELIKPR
jgi:hypothetical protein